MEQVSRVKLNVDHMFVIANWTSRFILFWDSVIAVSEYIWLVLMYYTTCGNRC
jgi:hypothetical protein